MITDKERSVISSPSNRRPHETHRAFSVQLPPLSFSATTLVRSLSGNHVTDHMKSKTFLNERDARVAELSEQLVEIEQRLIPTGLHVFGRAAELKEKADLLRMIGSFDRPEQDA